MSRAGVRAGVCAALVETDTQVAAALLSALGLAESYGGASAALKTADIDLSDASRLHGLAGDVERVVSESAADEPAREALALGYLAGRLTTRRHARTLQDHTSFVMDPQLNVRAAEGESILRLPWFEDGLFVGRELPEISEMPTHVRSLAVEHYRAAFRGERSQFEFVSYGHTYSVDAVPVRGGDGGVGAVLAVAVPGHSSASAVTAYEKMAERLDASVARAEQRADGHRVAGRPEQEAAERQAAEQARRTAERARSRAQSLLSTGAGEPPGEVPTLTSREEEVLRFASLGLTLNEIGDKLFVTRATVKSHLENIYLKLGVSEKAAAVAAALRHGLIQ